MKLDLYQAAKIPEYLAVLLFEREIRRHILTNGVYQLLPPDADGSWRSRVESGLWFYGQALLAGDKAVRARQAARRQPRAGAWRVRREAGSDKESVGRFSKPSLGPGRR